MLKRDVSAVMRVASACASRARSSQNFTAGPGHYILPRQSPSKLLTSWLIPAASLTLALLSLLSRVALWLPAGIVLIQL